MPFCFNVTIKFINNLDFPNSENSVKAQFVDDVVVERINIHIFIHLYFPYYST